MNENAGRKPEVASQPLALGVVTVTQVVCVLAIWSPTTGHTTFLVSIAAAFALGAFAGGRWR